MATIVIGHNGSPSANRQNNCSLEQPLARLIGKDLLRDPPLHANLIDRLFAAIEEAPHVGSGQPVPVRGIAQKVCGSRLRSLRARGRRVPPTAACIVNDVLTNIVRGIDAHSREE